MYPYVYIYIYMHIYIYIYIYIHIAQHETRLRAVLQGDEGRPEASLANWIGRIKLHMARF